VLKKFGVIKNWRQNPQLEDRNKTWRLKSIIREKNHWRQETKLVDCGRIIGKTYQETIVKWIRVVIVS
jgi:hypothetical protein